MNNIEIVFEIALLVTLLTFDALTKNCKCKV